MKTVVGVAWYSPGAWAELRSLAPDRDQLESTYEEWLSVFEKALADLRAAGLRPQRVAIEIGPFSAWCEAQGRRPDGAARAEYAAVELQRIHESRSDRGDA